MKISELNTVKTITRKVRKSDSSISDQKKNFKIPYNPNVEILFQRFFSKIIDMGTIIGIIVLLNKYGFLNTNDGYILLIIFFIGTIILIPILESLSGFSFGKILFGLEIVDDNCNKLTIPFSIYRNFYLYILLILSLIPMKNYIDKYEVWQFKNKFYVIKMKNKNRILTMMNNCK
jgi:uncharacterized RDD family membrane protein YckC